MKTRTDYHKEILGVSLSGRASKAKESTQTAGLFCFLCEQNDFEENKDLVIKILSAAKVDESIVVYNAEEAKQYAEVFAFGLNQEKTLIFESFAKISKSPELKKKLWGELKKRI